VLDVTAVRLPAAHAGVALLEALGGSEAPRLAEERVAAALRLAVERAARVALRLAAAAAWAGVGAPPPVGRAAAVVLQPEARGGLVARPEGQAAQAAPPSAAAWVFRRDQALPWPALPPAGPSVRAKES
jgi:hypothetical protein